MIDPNKVSISPGNIKMGAIPSVSLPAGLTCNPAAPCYAECYARKIERLRPIVANAYARNLKIYRENPKSFWKQIEAAVSMARYFRFHVSGDIPDISYLREVFRIARENDKCDILMFTKQDGIVNEFLKSNVIPKNLHIILSAWEGFTPDNPYDLPVCHVRFKDGYCAAKPGAKECGGNCTRCANTGGGCWTLQPGEELVINQH